MLGFGVFGFRGFRNEVLGGLGLRVSEKAGGAHVT